MKNIIKLAFFTVFTVGLSLVQVEATWQQRFFNASNATKQAILNHKNKIIGGALSIGAASYAYPKVAEFSKDEAKHQELRLAALDHPTFEIAQKFFPCITNSLVTKPLQDQVPYQSLDQFADETTTKFNQRKNIAKKLCEKNIPVSISQTEADILLYKGDKKQTGLERLKQKYSKHAEVANEMFVTEKHANQQGKVVLYHAMPTKFFSANYIGTRLHALMQQTEINNSFLELRQSVITNEYAQQTLDHFQITEDNCREKFLGRKGFDNNDFSFDEQFNGDFDKRTDMDFSQYLVSCCPSILGGSKRHKNKESALSFWIKGCTASDIERTESSATLLKVYNIPNSLIAEYSARLDKAEQCFHETTSRSMMLQIIFSSTDLLDETTYPAFVFGLRRNVYSDKHNQKKLLSKPSQIFETMQHTPFNIRLKSCDAQCTKCETHETRSIDQLQFRIIVDKSRLLDVNSKEVTDNFSVIPYSTNQEALEQFKQEVDEIFRELKSELKRV